ncbi:STP1 protein [Plasmodium brasilianum]|uniref:STP1 protein n=1 Tax=Plasmodium brasilianum TaxID=5824 RepID=A0ACB9YAM8_PLABR|nr:STP1 protein [Plasmodium brasilianum]
MSYIGFGFGAGEFITSKEYKEIKQYIPKEINSLRTETDKQRFRNRCLNLADYFILKKDKPPQYLSKPENWKPTLNNHFKGLFKKLKQHGGCPIIFEQKDKQLLQLTYEADNFCEERKKRKEELDSLKTADNISDNYESKCSKYNEWIDERKSHFDKNKDLVKDSTNIKKLEIKFPKDRKCDIRKAHTFEKINNCSTSNKKLQEKTVTKSNAEGPQDKEKGRVSHDFPITQDKASMQTDFPLQTDSSPHTVPSAKSESVSSVNYPPKTEPEVANAENPSKQAEDSESHDSKTALVSKLTEKLIPPAPSNHSTPVSEVSFDPETTTPYPKASSAPSHSLVSPSISNIPSPPQNPPIQNIASIYAIMGLLKKKKRIRTRQVKFLRLLIPPHSDGKSEFHTDDHLDKPICDDEEIIKKININEHNFEKNVNISHLKKDKSITIIEVHMEVLKECRNEEWELNKGEFLEICLEVFTKETYWTYSNLTNDKLIIENIKSSNNMDEQKILWNKWAEKHRSLSEKLKKEDWFNNLKNEWKSEQAYLKKSEELKKNSSNEIKNVQFVEREKDIWRQWISKKGIIIKEYIEQNWFKELSDELNNLSDVFENEQNTNDVSLIYKEELENKESYEELYKCIKEQFLEKLCTLILMMVIEECKKEEYIEIRESHLDGSINQWKKEGNLNKKLEITENTFHINGDASENRKNKEIHGCAEEHRFRNDIENWIREDSKYVSPIDNDEITNGYVGIAEKSTP